MQAIDRIVFHIGAYKTGTTAIQQSLVDAHETLLTRGVLYLETGRRGPGLDQLAKGLAFGTGPVMKTPGHFALLEELRASGASTLVLSAEDFAGWPWTRCVAWARGICEQLQPRSVDVLAYVRPQWEYAETQYTQFVKNGKSSASFDEYVEESMDQETRFDYMTVFEPWREAFGRRLEVRPYASELMFKGDAVEDFWHTVGLGSPPRTRNGSRQANRRPGAVGTEMLRALRILLVDHHLDEVLPLEAVFSRAQWRIRTELLDDRPFRRLTPEHIARIAERYSASNDEFVRNYFGGCHGSLFSVPTALEEPSAAWCRGLPLSASCGCSPGSSKRRSAGSLMRSRLGSRRLRLHRPRPPPPSLSA